MTSHDFILINPSICLTKKKTKETVMISLMSIAKPLTSVIFRLMPQGALLDTILTIKDLLSSMFWVLEPQMSASVFR